MTWVYVAIGLLSVAVLVLIGACWVALKGLGGISALKIQQGEHSAALERLDERVTREVKTRAALAGVERREEERSILEQAQAKLADPNGSLTQLLRPRRPYRRS